MWTAEIQLHQGDTCDITATWTEEGEEPITYSGRVQNKGFLLEFALKANDHRDSGKAHRRRAASLKLAAEKVLNG